MTESGNDFVPIISQIPGPRGPKGDTGAAAPVAASGKNAFTTTTAPFVMPAAGAAVTVTVTDTSWMAQGQSIFVETAGYFTATTILSATSVSLTAQAIPSNAAESTLIATGQKVTPGGSLYIDPATLGDYESRIFALETAPGKSKNWYANSAPAGGTAGLSVGDIWFDTGNGYKMYKWDGTTWVDIQRVLDLPDFGTGIRPILKVDVLPGTGSNGDFVWLSTDGHLYRRVGGAWTKAVETGQLVGTIDGTMIVDGTLVAQKLAANSVTADKVGANQIITLAANIGDGVITDAKIANLSAGKITAGDIQSVNLGYAGRIFHPSYSGKYFHSVDFGTSFADGKVFGAGNCLTTGYAHATPVTAYGPGHPSWTSGGVTACADSDGRVRVQVQGRLIGYTGAILIYGQVNSATPFALAARSSSDSGNAFVDCTRVLTGVSPTDAVKIFVAPAAGDGTVVPATCRFEVDAVFFNW